MENRPSSIQPPSKRIPRTASVRDEKPSTASLDTEQDPTSKVGQENPQPSATFTCFPKLPPELRYKIWEVVSFQRRNICIWMKPLGPRYGRGQFSWSRPFVYLSGSPHPAILHTCRESRTEGLKYYTLDFGVNHTEPSSPARIFINWKADRVCINDPDEFDPYRGFLFSLCKERGLRHVAINVDDLCFDDFLVDLVDGSTSFQKIILFSASDWVIKNEVLHKKRAALMFYAMSDNFILRADVWRDGKYNNKGDVKWGSMAYLDDLEEAEETLTKGFEKHEKKLAKKSKANKGAIGTATSGWARPEIKWCKAKLKLLP